MVRASMDWPRESQHIQAQSVSKDTLFSCLLELQFVPQDQSALHCSAHQLTRWRAAQDVAKSEMSSASLSSLTQPMNKPTNSSNGDLDWASPTPSSSPTTQELDRNTAFCTWRCVNTQTTSEDDECRTRASNTNCPRHAPLHSDGRDQRCNGRPGRI